MRKIISMLLLVVFTMGCSKKLSWFKTYTHEVKHYEFVHLMSGETIIMQNKDLDTVSSRWWIDYDLKTIVFKDQWERTQYVEQ